MAKYYPETLFHDLILENVVKFGIRQALVHDNQVITFEEIPQLVSKLVYKLLELGISQGDTILVCLPNSIWYPLLFLSCAKIGAVLSGISHESTAGEIKYSLKQSGAKLVFTNEKVSKENYWALSENSVEVLPDSVKTYIDRITGHEDFRPENLDIDSILLAPFSSGTTGAPKCCLLTHRNFLAATYSLKKFLFDQLLAQSSMKTLAFLPFHHASGFWALLICLLEGCTTYIMSEFHPIVMMDLIEKYEIDTINIVPPIANIFLKMGILQGRCPSLRTILCGSSGLQKDRCKRLLSIFPQVTHFIQGYGMTELVVLSCVTPFDDNFEHLGSCGHILPGFETKLFEHPTGETELWLKSDAIMKAYKNGTPNLDEDDWLHTGDIVTEKGGFFYVVDRMKDLIKLNGYQVSPTEIENVILTLPKVAEVAVVGIEDELCGQLPKAYIVLEKNADELLFLKHLEHTMKEKLSAVKQLRGGVSIIKEMPKSSSGKIQKNRLMYY
ncbi:Acyl-CoA synthetase family member 2, mitochondrial [Caenorhabditis elegans]|uniref:Acyl-CoA synthetase family member 2, mitochondrial n=1 Tax=Caenorhabditis elegans TaxID=6239 RepID=O02171_CAEEL|nr:Acyl-CoA synthetase family member 2, mitochondrial [Caenorhabditis elegans]CCD71067.1 Acyl-CoA synthetase family member 2, mitochondrial [Caenorhabditis elegans]|eukprot:NP_510728.2 fatty Acid CoA Synthetase family [Caenorhabditis elegans]